MAFVLLALTISVIIMQVPAAPVRFIDLSYSFIVNETIYWPGQKPFAHDLVFRGYFGQNTFATFFKYAAGEHGGTHMDAPSHFIEDGITLEKIPVDNLIGDAIVVNISAKADKDPDAELEVSDLEAWEKQHGRMPDKAIVFMYSGRGRYWPDPVKYFGTNTPNNSATFHFPGLHHEAAKWLIDNRKMKLFGLDTPSFDHGQNKGYPTHKLMLGRSVPGIENVANLHRLPPRGAEVFVSPMKIKGGSGGPCRVLARIADKMVVNAGTTVQMSSAIVVMVIAIVLFL